MAEPQVDPRYVRAFYKAALFLKERCEKDGWCFRANYLREHARASGLKFSNSDSPAILRALRRAHPELVPHVAIKPLKKPKK